MRKYGRWMLALGIMAASPAMSQADGLLSRMLKNRNQPTRSRQVQQPARRVQTRQVARPTPQVNPNQRMAESIAQALRSAQLRGYDVEIEFKNGVAVLHGKVKDESHRQKASQVVQALPGVNFVDNKLQLIPSQQTAALPSAQPIRQAAPPVRQAPVQQAPARQAPIQQVTAQTTPAPSQVKPAAWQTNGTQPSQVKQVSLPMAPPAREAAPQWETPAPQPVQQASAQFTQRGPSNQQVAENIAGAMSQAGLQGYDIEIRFQNGTAMLGGSVGTPQQRALAEQLASQISGVQSVSNQLQVTPPVMPVAFQQQPPAPAPVPAPGGQMGAPQMAAPVPMMAMGGGGHGFGSPNLPTHAWPAYAQYPNSAAITYPTQYSASAWPYIGPYYPYPQVPLGWRRASLEWDDGHWQLKFNSKTDKWWWFLRPKNWHE